jgi:hypothetical protein
VKYTDRTAGWTTFAAALFAPGVVAQSVRDHKGILPLSRLAMSQNFSPHSVSHPAVQSVGVGFRYFWKSRGDRFGGGVANVEIGEKGAHNSFFEQDDRTEPERLYQAKRGRFEHGW